MAAHGRSFRTKEWCPWRQASGCWAGQRSFTVISIFFVTPCLGAAPLPAPRRPSSGPVRTPESQRHAASMSTSEALHKNYMEDYDLDMDHISSYTQTFGASTQQMASKQSGSATNFLLVHPSFGQLMGWNEIPQGAPARLPPINRPSNISLLNPLLRRSVDHPPGKKATRACRLRARATVQYYRTSPCAQAASPHRGTRAWT